MKIGDRVRVIKNTHEGFSVGTIAYITGFYTRELGSLVELLGVKWEGGGIVSQSHDISDIVPLTSIRKRKAAQ